MRKGSRDLLLKFRDPLHITEMVAARNFKFGMHIDHEGHKQTKSKVRSKGIMWGHAIHFCNFGTTYNISGTVEARNFKFGTEIDNNKY